MPRIEPSNHEMVPEHQVMSKKEVEQLLNKLNIKKEQLPKIFESDPVFKGKDVEVGDVVKIKRSSPTAGKSTYYRLVIKGE